MAAANPLPSQRSEIENAVRKLRAREPLTEAERALVNRRGLELLELTDEPREPRDPGEKGADLDPEEEQHLLEALVEAEDDARAGKKGVPWREYFAGLRRAG
jgi:hypothetical protein